MTTTVWLLLEVKSETRWLLGSKDTDARSNRLVAISEPSATWFCGARRS
jgi:hypothetical protein